MTTTVSFTVSAHQAALLVAFHDILTNPAEKYDMIAPQTLWNYTPLFDIITSPDRIEAMLEFAGDMDDTTAQDIISFVKTRVEFILSTVDNRRA